MHGENQRFRSELKGRIEKKRLEIASLEKELREAQVYVQALEDTLLLLPREAETPPSISPFRMKELRDGSAVGQAREAILKAGRPLHIDALLVSLGRPINKDNKSALSASLAAYVRKKQIFTRPAPNTFGVIGVKGAPSVSRPVPPPTFGIEAP